MWIRPFENVLPCPNGNTAKPTSNLGCCVKEVGLLGSREAVPQKPMP